MSEAGGSSSGMSHSAPSIGPVDVRYDEANFTELLLYVADRLQSDRAGGATKLNKGAFFAQVTHLHRHHAGISGCEFQKVPHGPGSRQLLPVCRRLLASGKAKLVEEDFLGRPQQRVCPGRGGGHRSGDFWTGPLAAALVALRDFDALRYEPRRPEVRSVHVADPVFGPVVFVSVRVEPGVVELAAYERDPGYWDLIRGSRD